MSDEPERIDVVIEDLTVHSGEIMDSSGHTEAVVWIEGQGRRMHSRNEQVHVAAFLTLDQAEGFGVSVIKEIAVLDLALNLPIITDQEGDPDGPG